MDDIRNLSQIIETIQKLLMSTEIGVKVVNFENSLDLHYEEFEWLIEDFTSDNVKHYWFFSGVQDGRYDIFVFDNPKELKRIVIESYRNLERIFIKSIQLIRYPR